MEKQEFDKKIAEATQVIHRYCLSRTTNAHEAEDLAQEILLELCKSATNLRKPEAFYGFMWSVAGNVYKQWYKKKLSRNDFEAVQEDFELLCESAESDECNVSAEDKVFSEMENAEDIRLLRRELALLAEKYRRATVLYYLENKSCLEIANILSTSESMVKYLLFKSRKIVKDGITAVYCGTRFLKIFYLPATMIS